MVQANTRVAYRFLVSLGLVHKSGEQSFMIMDYPIGQY